MLDSFGEFLIGIEPDDTLPFRDDVQVCENDDLGHGSSVSAAGQCQRNVTNVSIDHRYLTISGACRIEKGR